MMRLPHAAVGAVEEAETRGAAARCPFYANRGDFGLLRHFNIVLPFVTYAAFYALSAKQCDEV